jgi:hypothetical protein
VIHRRHPHQGRLSSSKSTDDKLDLGRSRHLETARAKDDKITDEKCYACGGSEGRDDGCSLMNGRPALAPSNLRALSFHPFSLQTTSGTCTPQTSTRRNRRLFTNTLTHTIKSYLDTMYSPKPTSLLPRVCRNPLRPPSISHPHAP